MAIGIPRAEDALQREARERYEAGKWATETCTACGARSHELYSSYVIERLGATELTEWVGLLAQRLPKPPPPAPTDEDHVRRACERMRR